MRYTYCISRAPGELEVALLVEMDAVAPQVLGRVAGDVGRAEHRADVPAARPTHGADADPSSNVLSAQTKRKSRTALRQLLGEPLPWSAAAGEQHPELVAAESREGVRAAKARAGGAELAQQLVARAWPQVSFTTLNWSRSMYSRRGAGPRAGGLDRLREAALELAAVHQAGERVVARLWISRCASGARLGDVVQHEHGPRPSRPRCEAARRSRRRELRASGRLSGDGRR